MLRHSSSEQRAREIGHSRGPVRGSERYQNAGIYSRSGKRVAIVAVKDCSIDRIFRDRNVAYFSEKYDPEVGQRCKSLLETGNFDFILAYQQEYDDTMHATTPFDQRAIQAADRHIRYFSEICDSFDRNWKNVDRAILFAPDHGAHLDPVSKKGTHGSDAEEDMCLYHYYGFRKGNQRPA